jgi:CMP/dCMP kinase
MRKEIITIAGKPGSGKSTTANIVAKTLGFERYSAGNFFRALAERKGISIEEVNRLAAMDHSIDVEADAVLREIGQVKSKLVIDSRLAFHWIPDSFKVYLELDLAIAAERIFREDNEARRLSGEVTRSSEEMYESIANRFAIEQKRYYDLYKIDPYNTIHFDLVIDTTTAKPDEVAVRIIEAYEAWLKA